MKSVSSISASSSTDKSAASASAAAGNQAGTVDSGFLAMLDGLIQTMAAGQTNQNSGQANTQSNGQGSAGHQAGQNADQSVAQSTALDPADQDVDEDFVALSTPVAPVVTPAAVAVPPVVAANAAQGVLPAVAANTNNIVALAATPALTAPVPAAPLQSTLLQAGPLQAAPLQTAPVNNVFGISQVSVPSSVPDKSVTTADAAAASSQTASASTATVQPLLTAATTVGASTGFVSPVTDANTDQSVTTDAVAQPAVVQAPLPVPAKSGKTIASVDADSDPSSDNGQQSALIAAMFSQPVAAPIQIKAITGVSHAVHSSVSGAGFSPMLSPQPAAGNGTFSDTQGASASTAPKAASFGIGSDDSDSADDQGDDDTASQNDSTAQAAATQTAPVEQAKAQDFSALFPVVAETTAKATHTDTNDTSPAIGGITTGSDTGIAGLTMVHQTNGTQNIHATGTTLATSQSMNQTPSEQVSIVMQRAVSNGDRSMTISLNPVELGKVDVKLDIAKDGSVQASITADRPETLNLLKTDHHALTQALQNAGLSTDSSSLSFNLRDGGHSQQGQNSQSSAQNGSASGAGISAEADAGIQTLTATTFTYTASVVDGRVDVLA